MVFRILRAENNNCKFTKGEMTVQKSFGRRINKIRKEQGITSEALAVICGVNPVFIRQIEGGTRTPSLPVFVRICNALEMSPEYFLQDELKRTPIPATEKKS